jgi:hypothetical protein
MLGRLELQGFRDAKDVNAHAKLHSGAAELA